MLIVVFRLQLQWSGLQIRGAHRPFTVAFDHLTPDEVVWDPYISDRVDERVGTWDLSSLCTRDTALWADEEEAGARDMG